MKLRDKEKKNRTAIYMSVFIIFIMAASMFAIFFSNSGNEGDVQFNDYAFVLQTNPNDPHRYVTEINKKNYGFYFVPSELVDIPSNITGLMDAQYVIITFDPENMSQDEQQILDILRFDLAQYLNKPVAQGIVRETEGYDLPILGCGNATAGGPVIVLQPSESSSLVEQQGDCITVKGRSIGLLRAGTRLMYQYLGVMP